MTEAVGDAGPSFLDSLGDRGRRRAEPRTSISLAGAGCALGILGVLALAGDTGIDDAERRLQPGPGHPAVGPGRRHRLLRAGGRPAWARGHRRRGGRRARRAGAHVLRHLRRERVPAVQHRGILIVSTAAWLGTYLIGPGKGRPFFLGSGSSRCGSRARAHRARLRLPVRPRSLVLLRRRALRVVRCHRRPHRSDDGRDHRHRERLRSPRAGSRDRFDAPDPTTIGMLSLGARRRVPRRRPLARPRRAPRRRHPVRVRGAPLPGGRGDRPGRPTSRRPAPAAAGGHRPGPGPPRRHRLAAGHQLDRRRHHGRRAGRSSSATTPATTPPPAGCCSSPAAIGMVFIGHLIASAMNEPDELAVTRRAGRRATAPGPGAATSAPAPAEPAADPDAPWKPPIPRPPARRRPRRRRRTPRPRREPDPDPERRGQTRRPIRPTSRRRRATRLSRAAGPRSPSPPPPGPAGWVRGYGLTKPLPGSSVVAKRTMAVGERLGLDAPGTRGRRGAPPPPGSR